MEILNNQRNLKEINLHFRYKIPNHDIEIKLIKKYPLGKFRVIQLKNAFLNYQLFLKKSSIYQSDCAHGIFKNNNINKIRY